MPPAGTTSRLSGLWRRQLESYPDNGPRAMYLAITVLATIVLYYELYIQGAVATKIIADYHMTFTYFVMITAIGNLAGAFAALFAGLADRWGRANLVAYGLVVTALLILFGLPNAPTKGCYLFLFTAVTMVEGVMLVATPALIRDFSPQLGRASAMGFWSVGPVLGSLVVTEVSSHTLRTHPDWRFHFYVCGIVGLVVAAIAIVGLRELSPRLRDQLMVSLHDKALIEARAANIDPEAMLSHQWRQMLRLDIIGPAFAISIFLIFYYIAVGFFVVYFATNYGYPAERANSLANWYWIGNAIALVAAGLLSDKLKVRKPFMVIGALISLVGIGLFASATTNPDTGYYTLAGYILLISAGGGIAYCAWTAAFTETVEKHNPAATATGLAVWGWIIRTTIFAVLVSLTYVVSAATTLVDTAGRHPDQVALLAAPDKADLAVLKADPNNMAALSSALGAIAGQDSLNKAARQDSDGGLRVTDAEQGAAGALRVRVSQAVTRRAPQLQTVNAIDPGTRATLQKNPTDGAASSKAIAEIARTFKITPQQATQRLLALAPASLGGSPAVQADLGLVTQYANILQSRAGLPESTVASLQQAQHDNPKQWRNWWWVCFAAQVAFLPFVFLLTGRWSPRGARRDAQAHERLVDAELRGLTAGRPINS